MSKSAVARSVASSDSPSWPEMSRLEHVVERAVVLALAHDTDGDLVVSRLDKAKETRITGQAKAKVES